MAVGDHPQAQRGGEDLAEAERAVAGGENFAAVFGDDEGVLELSREGAVAREDLDKAIGHGLSHAPVKGIMSARVATTREDAPLAEVQIALASAPAGRIA